MSGRVEEIFAFLDAGLPPKEDAGLFGATLTEEEASLHVIGVPWDATTSYRPGTSLAPARICRASHQLDLADRVFGKVYREGIAFLLLDELAGRNQLARQDAEQIIQAFDEGREPDASLTKYVDAFCEEMNQAVYMRAKASLEQGKRVALFGGDHSTPYGLIRALSERYESFGILQIDAHLDLRRAYEGFAFSHASICYNLLRDFPQISRLTSVGIRDYSAEEAELADASEGRVKVFYDEALFEEIAQGTSFSKIVHSILETLPPTLYLTLDIDGLTQAFCPQTGTPVPGGLTFQQVVYLIHQIAKSGRKIIGFDIVEVTPSDDEWDLNVASRLLYKLCGLLTRS